MRTIRSVGFPFCWFLGSGRLDMAALGWSGYQVRRASVVHEQSAAVLLSKPPMPGKFPLGWFLDSA